MMKLIENQRHNSWWRELRREVRTGRAKVYDGLPIPTALDALILDFKVE